MSVLTQFTGSGIKSIQRGSALMTGTGLTLDITISSVNTAKAVLTNLGTPPSSSATYLPGLELVNATTLRATTLLTPGGNSVRVFWQVVEFN